MAMFIPKLLIDKIVELYDKLLESEKEKVTMLQEVLREKK